VEAGLNVRVHLFAAYREAAGIADLEIEVPPSATPDWVWSALLARFPALRLRAAPAFAVTDEYVMGDHPLRDGDEVAMIPPVSGGADAARVHVSIVPAAISVDDLLVRVADPHAGAIALFLGTVRQNPSGPQVRHLDYEAYVSMAEAEMRKIAAEAARRWPVRAIGIVHRLGRLAVGETSVAIAVSTPHRQDAFEAGRFAIDTLKRTVPIWKKEVWDREEFWVGADPDRP
jgi:molybdopterin synthase catalytic subunit